MFSRFMLDTKLEHSHVAQTLWWSCEGELSDGSSQSPQNQKRENIPFNY